MLYYIEQDSGSFNEYNEVIAVALVTNEQAIKALRNYSVSVTAIGNKMLRKISLYAIIFSQIICERRKLHGFCIETI